MSDPSATLPPLTWADLREHSVGKLSSVSAGHAETLETMGIVTVADLVTTYPRRWEDRRHHLSLGRAVDGDEGVVLGTLGKPSKRTTQKGHFQISVPLIDRYGNRIELNWFNQRWRWRQIALGMQVVVFGTVTQRQGLSMMNPTMDWTGTATGRVVSIYPQSPKRQVMTAMVENWISEACDRIAHRGLIEPFPDGLLASLGLLSRPEALAQIHQPITPDDAEQARRRLAFDEVFQLQVGLAIRRHELGEAPGHAHDDTAGLMDAMVAQLPYEPTGAQARVLGEIRADMLKPTPMHRLLQGDVGAGKTFVAAAAIALAVGAGRQGVMLAPTSVLATQHLEGVSEFFEGLEVDGNPVEVALLTNKTKAAERRRILAGLEDGSIQIAVGTHSLLSDKVVFDKLGLVVVDEQHRFGVDQRSKLSAEDSAGRKPDVIVMTATPIPRTAAMTVYGDLEVSILDELPPGRTPIVTTWANGVDHHPDAWEQVRFEVAKGHQAFIVVSAIEAAKPTPKALEAHAAKIAAGEANEGDSLRAAKAAQATADELAAGPLKGLSIEVLHGKQKAEQRTETMERFNRGELDVMVATTVIEVGVNVPNATVMVVCDADRFGIAQLHQLRGRVGRGIHPGQCWLLTDWTEDGNPRLEALVASTNGFELAEVDLELRGEGALTTDRQSGRNGFKLLELGQDRDLIIAAREAAAKLVADDPNHETWPDLYDEITALVTAAEVDKLEQS